jgi:signal peptidase I
VTSRCSTPPSKPRRPKTLLIKRIVAGPGDEIFLKGGRVWRKGPNGASFDQESDSHVKPCEEVSECNFPTPIKIPTDRWFVLGDNRGESDDSRFWGPVPTGWIVGVVH